MKRTCLALVAAALAGLAGSARAQTGVSAQLFGLPTGAKMLSQTAVPVQAQGEVVVSFRGDATTGCASYGLCSYTGTIVVRPHDGELTVVSFRKGRRISDEAALFLGAGNGGFTMSAHVQRSVSGGQGGTCADAQTSSFPPNISTVAHGSSITIRLLARGGSLLESRCAGPLDADLGSVSPTATISLARARRGRTMLDLSGTRTFATHGFAGTISSTLMLHLGRPQRQPPATSVFPPGIKTQRTRIVTEHLRLIRVAGHLGMTIRGSDDPVICQLLDTCGLSGTLTLGRIGSDAALQVIAQGPARRPYRDFLTALSGGHERGISVVLLAELLGGVDETTTQGGATCTDTTGIGGVAVQAGAFAGRSIGSGSFAGSWRTRCPGPALGDLSAGVAPSLAPHALTHRQFTIQLRATGLLSDDGYLISPIGRVSVLLGRGRISQQVLTTPTG